MRVVILSLVLISGGCAHRLPHERQLSLAHQVTVPATWTSGRGTPGPSGGSDIERYVGAYERGWWTVVREYANNIDYVAPPDLWTSSGWPAATCGWERGVGDASIRIEQLIDAFGKRRASEYLSQYKDSVWYGP